MISILKHVALLFKARQHPPPPVGQGLLLIQASLSHSGTPHSVGLLWTRDRPVVETSTLRHTTLTKEGHPCTRRDSNPQSQQASGRKPTGLRPCGEWDRPPRCLYFTKIRCILKKSITTHTHNFGVLRWRTKCHTQSQNLYGRHISTHHHHHHQQQQQQH